MKLKKKKLQKIIGRAIRNPANFDLDDLARLIYLKYVGERDRAERERIAENLRQVVGTERAVGFRRDGGAK